MKSMKNILTFTVPNLTAEEWEANDRECAEWEKKRQEQERVMRLDRGQVPIEYRDAKALEGYEGWLENPNYGLLLTGKAGRGKTYTACSLLIEAAKTDSVRFATFGDLIREIKATFEGIGTERDIIDKYAYVKFLCIDDVGKEKLTEWSQALFFAVIDKRKTSLKPTIITTNYDWQGLLGYFKAQGKETSDAIASRLSLYTYREVVGEDRRLYA